MCLGCFRGWKCFAKAWGKCILKRPRWRGCCIRIRNPLCLAANAACWALKKSLDLILKAAVVVVNKSRRVLDVAKVALSLAQGVLHASKKTLGAANVVLKGIKNAYKVGANALSALVKFAGIFGKLIDIRHIYFRSALGKAKIGEFECRVRGVLIGANLDIMVKFNIRDVLSLIKNIAERAISGLSKFVG